MKSDVALNVQFLMPWSLLVLLAQAGQPFAIPPAETAAELAADAQELDESAGRGTQNDCSISVAESERFRITRRLKRSCP